MVLVNCTADTLKKSTLRDRTDRAWFNRFVRHPVRKWSGSILSTPEPAIDIVAGVRQGVTAWQWLH